MTSPQGKIKLTFLGQLFAGMGFNNVTTLDVRVPVGETDWRRRVMCRRPPSDVPSASPSDVPSPTQ
jgi:hypothetical protein